MDVAMKRAKKKYELKQKLLSVFVKVCNISKIRLYRIYVRKWMKMYAKQYNLQFVNYTVLQLYSMYLQFGTHRAQLC